jgi:hypothetical protein
MKGRWISTVVLVSGLVVALFFKYGVPGPARRAVQLVLRALLTLVIAPH